MEGRQATAGDELRFHPRGRIVPAADVEAWQTGCGYLDAAKREAKRIRTDAVDAFEQEKQRGFAEGRKEGAEAAAQLLTETSARADRYLADADGQLVDLAMAVVQRVLGDFDVRDLTLRAVEEALSKQRKDQPLVVYASPEMIDRLCSKIDESVGEGVRHLITVEADPKLEVGDCRLASEVGFVELGIEAQLRALHQGLRHGLKRPARD